MESSENVFLGELLWSSCKGSNEECSSTGVLKELCMGNKLNEDVLRNYPVILHEVLLVRKYEEYISSTGIPKELCMGNGPQNEGYKNSP